MDILQKIIIKKEAEVAVRKEITSIEKLKQSAYFNRTCLSVKERLLAPYSTQIIAEFKRQSPSKGIINKTAKVETVTKGYADAGVCCLSILTDQSFFGGCNADLIVGREINPNTPILRKEFMVDEYQVYEAKSIGADLILLIAASLTKGQATILARLAKELGMEVLMEVHSAKELELVNNYIDIVGVNNRNLKTFEVSIQQSIDLFDKIPSKYVKISESGLSNPSSIVELRKTGYQGFLIGENFMKTDDPALACKQFIDEIKSYPV